jgi:serine/threonine protein kinase
MATRLRLGGRRTRAANWHAARGLVNKSGSSRDGPRDSISTSMNDFSADSSSHSQKSPKLSMSESEAALLAEQSLRPSSLDADGSTTEIDVEPKDYVLSSSSEEERLTGSVVAESYIVLDLLGEGAMGRVYEVEHAKTGRHLAMKVLRKRMANDPEIARRFIREALAVSKLRSPCTVAVIDHGLSSGAPFMVMELVRGRTVGEVLREQRHFTEARALRVGIDVCAALAEAHDHGIVHRDIKPDNVMLVRDDSGHESVKVLDFGLAKVFAPDGPDLVSSAGMVVGTPHYMSPEQIRGSAVDGRSDIYSVGTLLYRMLTGKRPFSGGVTEVLSGHLTEMPRSPSAVADVRVSPSVSDLVMQCLAKDPAERFQNAFALASAISSVLARVDVGGYRGDVRTGGTAIGLGPAPGGDVTKAAASPAESSSSHASGTALLTYERRLRKGSRLAEVIVFGAALVLAALLTWIFVARG